METEIQKISWLRRLFMSWRLLFDYFQNYVTQQLTEQTAVLKQKLQEREKEIVRLETKLQGKEKHYEDLVSWKKSFQEDLNKKENLLAQKEQEIQTIQNEKEILVGKNNNSQLELEKTQEVLDSFRHQFDAQKVEINNLKNNIANKLLPLEKIERTFFATNKGKGNLGEMQLEVQLQQFNIDHNLWQNNLQVGDKIVEFAFQSGYDNHKWIPVDSKVLDHETNEKEIIIDASYETKIREQAKKVSQYLDKSNTTKYGILVIQNDAIYLALWQKTSFLFSEIFRQYKVYVLSPSLFIQFAFSLSEILKVQIQVSAQEKIFDRLNKLVNKIIKYGDNIRDAYLAFNEATAKNWPSIRKQTEQLVEMIPKNDTMKTKLLKWHQPKSKDSKCSNLLMINNKD